MRFAQNDFQYNARVAVALVPSLAVLAGFGGTYPVGVLLVGAMVTYILDALRYREGALASVWLTLGGANQGLLLTATFTSQRPILLSILMALCNGFLLSMIGVWATLQFRWVQLQYPVAIIAAEKLLMSCTLPIAGITLAWGSVAAVGATAAAFYAAAFLYGLFYLLARPLPSSFQAPVKAGERHSGNHTNGLEGKIQSRLDGGLAACLVVLVPIAMFVLSHWGSLQQSVHFWSLVLLSSGPMLLITCLHDGLWWLPLPANQQQALRRVLLLASLTAALAGLEGRVLFRAFGQYLGLQPPWSYIVVSFALYSGAALVVLHVAGLLGDVLGSTFGAVALVLTGGAGALAAGMPPLAMPAPMLAASGLVLFSESQTLRDYSLFAVGATVTGAWFVVHHHWFLDVWLAGWSLQGLCIGIIAAMGLAALLPGLVATKAPAALVGAITVAQAVLVALLEEHLYAGEHEQGSDEMYPAFLVVLTSGLGLAMVRHLAVELDRLGPVPAWAAYCTHGSKLAMLLLPESRMAAPVLLVALSVSAPAMLYEPGPGSVKRRRHLPAWLGLLHAASIAAAVVGARFALFDALAWLGGRHPSEGLLIGALLAGVAGGCFPLVMRFYGGSRAVRRALLLAGVLGAAMLLLQPPLPIQGGAECPHLPFGLCPRVWDAAHVPERLTDDAAIYGDPLLAGRAHWPLWLLAAAALAALSAATSETVGQGAGGGLLGHAAACGGCVGAYLALELFPGQSLMQGLVVATTLAVAAVLLLLRLPAKSSPGWLPWLLLSWGAALPLELLLHLGSDLPEGAAEERRLYADFQEGEHERRLAQRMALLAVHAAQALLLGFAFKLKVAAADAGRGRSGLSRGLDLPATRPLHRQRSAGFLGACLPAGLSGRSAGLATKGLEWLPGAGNAAVALCFVLCLALNASLTQGADEAILVLAPMLLLLNSDAPDGLSARRQHARYAPCAAAVSVYLAVSALWQLGQQLSYAFDAQMPATGLSWSAYVGMARDLLALALALPHHIFFLQFLWSSSPTAGSLLAALSPTAALAGVLTGITAVRWLAGLALAAALTQYLAMRHLQQQGQKVI